MVGSDDMSVLEWSLFRGLSFILVGGKCSKVVPFFYHQELEDDETEEEPPPEPDRQDAGLNVKMSFTKSMVGMLVPLKGGTVDG